ncbi:HAD family hydrolase [Tundrisphaera lichenicola]|uniref:HAD family hydrolase n=1 Tax=Tundrisphaera lichenicola TaxID=2029860 RepID=UPI003EB8D676
MTFRAVMFDLDGTLLDTLADIATAANQALDREGMPTHPSADFRRFIGDGVAMLFRRALPPDRTDDALVGRCVAAFHDAYSRVWHDQTRPYEGITELLDALVGRDLVLSVLSNKPDDFTQLYGNHYLARWPFRVVLGQRDHVPRKPDPAGALEIADRLEIDPAAFVYVGDSGVDMKTAKAAGMFAVGVSWGFRPVEELRATGADAIIDHPSELLGLLE